MKKVFILLCISLVLYFSCTEHGQQKYTKLVDPFIGTGGTGHTFPGATLPSGMVQLSPDTGIKGWNWCSGYHESDSSLMGFSHTHLSGTGGADYGDILLMPTVGKLQLVPGSKENPDLGYRSRFRHEKENASPGYYSVYLDDYGIQVELTATVRTGFHRYLFPKSDSSNIIIDLSHGIQDQVREAHLNFVGENKIEGLRRSRGWAEDQYVYFVMEFSRPFESFGTAVDDQISQDREIAKGKNIKAFVRFNTSKEEEVLVKVGISAVNIEGARKNLEAEIPHWDFDRVYDEAIQTWENVLGKVKVDGGNKDQRAIFYTALYHSLIHPGIFMDVDGQYRGMDLKVHQAKDFNYYSVFSLWDTYRALHPLFTIIEPERDLDMIRTLLAKYNESGLLPIWELASNETGTMIGYHSIPVIVDAYMKGLRDFDIEKTYEAMKHSADMDHLGLKSYKQLGYVASKLEHQSVSKTLEYAYDDWCMAIMAKELGHQADYERFSKRANNYMNLFDGYSGFMRGKGENGSWEPFFNPFEVTRDFTEANAWQYSMYVPHDVNGLINLYGGKEQLSVKIDEVFSTESKLEGKALPDITGLIGQYAHGNEPSHHMAYLYDFTGQGWKTQERIREIMDIMYTNKPDGLAGNEDCGQMSAWYVMSALGFYPVCPGTGQYLFGSPIFEKTVVELENGNQFTVKANNVSPANKYIQSVSLNGKPYTRTYLEHASIVSGGELVFDMGPVPNKEWGTKSEDLPYSFSEGSIVSPPYQKTDATHFESSVLADLASRTDGVEIRYTLDGSKPDKSSQLFTEAFRINETTLIKARAYKDNLEPSMVTKIEMNKLVYREPDKPGNVVNGLSYEYFEGPFRSVKDIAGLKARKSGIVSNFSLREAEAEDHFAFRYTGYIKIPAYGLYRFYTRSDDGSVLYIGDTEIVNNDGSHGSLEASGIVALKAGYHPITVLYFEDYEGHSLWVLMESPEGKKHRIPGDMLFRKK